MKKYISLFLLVVILACSGEDDSVSNPTPPVIDENPVAKADELSAVENEAYTFNRSKLLENDEIVDNAIITSIDSETEAGGSITDNRDNTYTYEPAKDFTGNDTFSYTICVPGDSERCSSAIVTVIVGDAGSPVAEDDSFTMEEGKTYTISNHLENDDVVDNAVVTSVESASGNATVTLQEDGSILYEPEASFSGQDSFTYTLCDDDETPNCSTATITIQVQDTGSPVANDDTVVIELGTTEEIITKLLENDDLTDDAVISSIDDSGSNASIVLNNDGTVSYKPKTGFKGEDSFSYSICDDDAEATCSTATVTVNIVEVVKFNIPDNLKDYYADATFSVDPDLLYAELSDFTNAQHTNRLEYVDRHDYLYDADADLDDDSMVVLVYSGELRPDDEYQLGDLDGDESFNTEHIYPQSRLNTEESVSDLHLLRVADAEINSERLNYPFTDGSGEYKLIDGDKWFPGDDWRGDVARIIMYVNLSYGDSFTEVGNLELFLKWNREDPVSAFELQRNNVIENAQGNRNPFIDNPFLATLIWGGASAENTWE
ncbi:Ig-like domain-containing protein [Christiangramia sp.]|uniref:Ig-like domain-containing protein n=1 Tax=Christiangramia sp. TaxID=1931228 RepID=UPI0026301B76|nr:Ig-like domain-containing protein [Christiangramia sp.]